ncbi:hypothetical protein DTO282F9_9117 [Paecilomyces variotii]|nr:hypothetical protein DTO282F9_9117 [Paecilomyces variotii]
MPLTVTANPQVDTNGAQGVVDISLHHQQKLLIFETQRLIMFAGNVLYRLISYRMINFRRIADELRDHNVEQHNLCVDCGQFFQNRNNLEMHKQRHTPRDLECYGHDHYGCEQIFKTFSGMLIHLESGSCISGTTEGEIDDLARACYQSRKYRRDLENGGWLYMCPGCERDFSKLSSLFQHAESIQSCSSYTTGNGCLAKLRELIRVIVRKNSGHTTTFEM